ncbi:MAG TPA: fused MFS/spermidine synthase [Vicinamibacterales bacterium]|nr:fused MFS/spermidine synthase [Acidobacteriota bacterium]HQX81587.1 fused MFS/spermidine synthase [Vicinamibacterales bacterium]
MTERVSQIPVAERVLPAMLALFVGSGCAALIYEVVWFQMLQLSLGSSAVSLGVLLGTFMGGMCLGSWLFPKYVGNQNHPLRMYAYLELGIGVCGILVLLVVPLLGGVYTAIAGTGQFSVFMRGLVAAVVLLPPTLMMGATLPAISRWVEATPRGVGWLGFFYGGNIAGAVVGCLLAGFYLLRVFDMATATFVAVALNVIVGLLALTIANRAPYDAPDPNRAQVGPAPGSRVVYITIALSGLTALAAQVIWTRVLSLLFGATVYTFSLILAVFLVGLGIGSSLGASMARSMKNPRAALGWTQMLLCVALAYAAYMTNASMPFWPINPQITSGQPFMNFQLDLMRATFVILPGAILWGMSFPLALASVASRNQDPARLVGGVYAANTVGAIVGALFASLLAVAWIGSQQTQMALIGISAIAGLMMLASSADDAGKGRTQLATMFILILVTGGAGLLARSVPPMPWLLVAYGRYAATWVGQNEIIYMGEGMTASVAVSRTPNGVLNYHNAGKVQASSEPQDMRLQRLLGHMTTLIPENPKSVLVIGCGAGVTAGAVSIDPVLSAVTIAEIEPLVPEVVSKYFSEHNFAVVQNPKVRVHLDDARHFLLTTKEKFDAVTSDPLDPWVKGAATLYTREFFDVVKAHLNPGGVVTLFVQLYESSDAAVKSEIATFLEAFPQGVVFANTINGQGYDLVLVGQLDPKPIDVDRVQARLSDPANAAIAKSLSEIGVFSAVDLFGTYGGRKDDMGGWLAGAQINRDRNLRLQYLAGLGLNLYEAAAIYRNMSSESRYPEGLFTGSPETIEALRAAIARAHGR